MNVVCLTEGSSNSFINQTMLPEIPILASPDSWAEHVIIAVT